jgi:Bacterial conjugation TrbI-like protein
MKEKFRDLKVYVEGSRKAKFFLIIGILAILFLVFSPQPGRQTKMVKPQKKPDDNRLAQPEAADDVLIRFKGEVEELKKQTIEQRKELAEQRKLMYDYEQRTAEILKKMLERMADGEQQTANAAANAPATMNEDGYVSEISQQDEKLEAFGLEEPEVGPPPPPPVQKMAFIGAGDSVRLKLLAGVNAPTDGTPYPVVFQLISDVYGPDGSTLPLGEARLIAAAQGSLTDSRALFRLTSLNLALPSGERKVYDVDGWVVGEDGIRGMPGVLIDPIGKALGGAAIAGGVQGLGMGLQQGNSRVIGNNQGGFASVVDGNLGEFAAGRAAQGAAREWTGIIRERLSNLVPVVQVLSGREATAVFAKSLSIEGLFEALEEEEYQYTGLD